MLCSSNDEAYHRLRKQRFHLSRCADFRGQLFVQTYNSQFNESIINDQYVTLLIKLGDKGFIEWRYVYESAQYQHLDVQLQSKITDSLGKCIEAVLNERGL
jgi:hypothetical protein